MPVVTATQGFINALRFGATLVQARLTPYVLGSSTGVTYYAAMSTGSITVDRNSSTRRSGTITIEVTPTVPPPVLMPVSPQSLLAPFGNEVFIEVGIASSNTPAGTVAVSQWVPLGLFAIVTAESADTTVDLVVTLNLKDRSNTISIRKFKQPYNFPAGSGNFVDEIMLLLNQVWNQTAGVAPLQFNITPTDATVPVASYNQGADPWQAATDMANVVGYELFFDVNGVVTGRPIPNPLLQPVTWNFTDDQTTIEGLGGPPGPGLLTSPYTTPTDVTVSFTQEGVVNDIVIQGTGTANAASPILAEAADNNPASPTYIGGGLGDIPNFVSSSLITDAGAQSMANNDLQQALSSSWTITLQVPQLPILDIDDVVQVTRPRVGLNNALVVIDAITHAVRFADVTAISGRVLSNNN